MYIPVYNKHTESIAKAIQVPHQSQQVQICKCIFKKEQLELLLQLKVFLFYYMESNFEQRAITHVKVGQL